MITFRFLLFIIFITIFADATIHEDAEDKRASRWKLVSARDVSSVNSVWDKNKKSHVIEFKGEGTQHSYALKINKKTQNEHFLSWDMQFSDDFVVIVLLKTNMGKYHLIYTPGSFRGYMQYGLGSTRTNGKWQKVQRNLLEDIAYFDNRVKNVSLVSFVVKGVGRVDNIMTRRNELSQKIVLPKKIGIEKINKKHKVKKVFKSSLPIIKLKGIRLVKLALGEEYIEEGVSAYDKEDGKLNVESSNDINPYKEGRYMVLYMTQDSDGNMAVDKRYVEVGDVKKIKKEVSVNNVELSSEDDENNEEDDYLVEQRQIAMWERELARKEKELANKRAKR